MRPKRYAKYTPEFRACVTELLLNRNGRTLRDIAASLGLQVSTARTWYINAVRPKQKPKRESPPKPPTDADEAAKAALEEHVKALEAENRKLQREVENLRVDREILKKAAAFSAKRKG